MNIKKEIMEEFKKKFVMKSMYGNHINFHADPVLDFLSQALTRIEEAAYREGMAYKGKAVREAYQHGYREGIHEGYNQKMEELTPSEEKECFNHCVVGSKIICQSPNKEKANE